MNSCIDIILALRVVLERRSTQYVVYQRLLLCHRVRHVLVEQWQFVQCIVDARGDLDVILVGLLGDIVGEDARKTLVLSFTAQPRVLEKIAAF